MEFTFQRGETVQKERYVRGSEGKTLRRRVVAAGLLGRTPQRPMSKGGGRDWAGGAETPAGPLESSVSGGPSEPSQIEAKWSHVSHWPLATAWEEVKPWVRQSPGDQGSTQEGTPSHQQLGTGCVSPYLTG